jgi:hypothetical protein
MARTLCGWAVERALHAERLLDQGGRDRRSQ